jgi:hypothetical protein
MSKTEKELILLQQVMQQEVRTYNGHTNYTTTKGALDGSFEKNIEANALKFQMYLASKG